MENWFQLLLCIALMPLLVWRIRQLRRGSQSKRCHDDSCGFRTVDPDTEPMDPAELERVRKYLKRYEVGWWSIFEYRYRWLLMLLIGIGVLLTLVIRNAIRS